MKRRIFSVLLSSALLLTALAGCGQGGEAAPSGSSSDADSETGTRDELIFVNYRDIRDLNPHLYAGEMYAQSILYDTLVSNTEDGYVGCLAEDWTISDDGRIYTFNIRDGVTFSDGTPCDANAILANFNAILENRERHTWLEMMNLLVGVSAPDEDTFVIEMSEPYYPMLTELACIRPFAMISPRLISLPPHSTRHRLGPTARTRQVSFSPMLRPPLMVSKKCLWAASAIRREPMATPPSRSTSRMI